MDPADDDEQTTHPAQDGADQAEALGHVVDDDTPREESGRWAVEQLTAGQTVESIVETLMANGWSSDDAEEIAELARRQTRHLRGALTHDDAARAYQVGDPNVISRVIPVGVTPVLGPLAGLTLIGSAIGLARAIRRLWRTRKLGRR